MPLAEVPRERPLPKRQFHAVLRDWIDATQEAAIGPEDGLRRTPWIHVRDGSTVFALNADTQRAAVREYLRLAGVHGDDIAWEIAPSRRKNMTAVVYGPSRVRLKPFYLYVVGGVT